MLPFAALLLQATPMAMPAESCPRTPPALPAALAGWRRPTPVAAGTSADTARTVTLGRGVRAVLSPMAAVTLAVAGKPAPAGSSSGVFAFTVANAGRYQVALDTGAWIDVVAGGGSLPSVAHGHGPACSGIRKLVGFDLMPGRYLLQVVGSPRAIAEILVVRG